MKWPLYYNTKVTTSLLLIITAAVSYTLGGLSYHAQTGNKGGGEALYIYNQAHTSKLQAQLKRSRTICFIGDSITAGSENGGYPWYGPLVAAFPHIQVESMAVGGGTSKSLLQLSRTKLRPSDLYIIALGTNDIRYRDPRKGATTTTEYIDNLKSLVARGRELSSTAQFIFIAPWCSIPEDPIPPISQSEKESLMKAYSKALQQFCQSQGHLYLDPNPILDFLIKHPQLRKHYMQDHIHPTHPHGCYLYSAAVWEAASVDVRATSFHFSKASSSDGNKE